MTADPSTAGRVFEVTQIGTVSSERTEVVDDDWDSVVSTITLVGPYQEASLAGLDAFSHLDVLYLFDRVNPLSVHTGARRPRGNPAWPEVGIFAQRARDRPNRIGLCTCALVGVDGMHITVRGLDALDGTPVLDIKPVMTEFGPRGEVRQPPWSHELMARYF